MTELDKIVLRAAILKILNDRVAAAFREAKQAATQHLGAEGRKNAVFGKDKLASVSVTKTGRVTIDEAVLTAWVSRTYPTEVETTTRIRPVFLDAIKTATAEAGEPCTPFGDLDVPGVDIGEPYPLVRKAPGADELVEKLWQTGRLMINGDIREIE